MKRLIFILVMSGICTSLAAQKQMNNWFFGYNVGLTWNYLGVAAVNSLSDNSIYVMRDMPQVVNSPLATNEGCFAMSDKDGNLLFFSDGTTVWDKNHNIMKDLNGQLVTSTYDDKNPDKGHVGNGLTGHTSSAQSGIVINYPGQKDKYIAITVGHRYNDSRFNNVINGTTITNNLAYSVIDMSLNGGLGVVTEKNIPLNGARGLTGESLTAVRHSNGTDFWIIAPGKGSTTYLNVWKVTSAGVEASAPHSYINAGIATPIPSDVVTGYANGYIRFDIRGKNFAWAIHNNSSTTPYGKTVVYGTFDAGSGNFQTVKTFTPGTAYGVEFSPSGKYLYLTIYDTQQLRVYNYEQLLSSSSPNTVPYKSVPGLAQMGAAQLGPDRRLYYLTETAFGDGYIGIVEYPDDYDNLKAYSWWINSGNYRQAFGFPTFSASWLDITIDGESEFCNKEEQEFILHMDAFPTYPDYIVWKWGDGNSERIDVASGQQTYTRKYTYNTAGTYTIEVDAYNNTNPNESYYTVSKELDVQSCYLEEITGPDEFCNNTTQTFSIDLQSLPKTPTSIVWRWSDDNTSNTVTSFQGTTSPISHTYTKTGTYLVEVDVYIDYALYDTQTKQVTVLSCDMDDITGLDEFCYNISQSFSIGLSSLPSTPTHLIWHWGDGNNDTEIITSGATSNTSSHIYTTPGTYTITVEAYLAGNSTTPFTTQTKQVIVNPCGMDDITGPNELCIETSQEFSIGFGSLPSIPSRLVWNWGDSTSDEPIVLAGSTSSAVSHTYDTPGTYTISVQVYLSGSATPYETKTKQVEVQLCNDPSLINVLPVNPNVRGYYKQ